jgi:catechol 2,3-dioxygenase-like lactoylglutathione lyase family enzyme
MEDFKMRGVSHVAIGVRNMDRALGFYRDLMDLRVVLDEVQDIGGIRAFTEGTARPTRRVVHLVWQDGDWAPFIVLSEFRGVESPPAPKLNHVGVNHFALWVEDLKERATKLEQAGVKFVLPPSEVGGPTYGGGKEEKVLTCIFEDPDGTLIQLDQHVS